MNHTTEIKTQLDAVLYFVSKMDVDMVSTLLEDERSYQDLAKGLFIRKLGDLFHEFRQLGDFTLLVDRGECYGCSCGVSGFTFVGNKSRAYIDMVFIVDEAGQILDIYECGEFFNKRSKVKKKHRLYLDKYVDFNLEDEEDDDYWEGDDPSWDDDVEF